MKKLIYLDNAATTPCYEEVAELVKRESVDGYFNPSALYKPSVDSAVKLKKARDTIKSALHATSGELYFTSGGSEANNTALFCTRKPKNSRIIVGLGEHDAVLNPANELKNQGYDVVFAPINTDGSVNVDEFKKLLNENVSFVSIMHVSNETGAVNDIARLVKLTRKLAPNAVFHSDGVQAFEKISVNLRALDVDLYSISAHKIHGPKGIGALYVKKGVSIKPLIFGGGQEKGFRSGTENLPSILGFERTVELNEGSFEQNYSKKCDFKEYLTAKLRGSIDDLVIISPAENCVPNILTVAFKDVRGEVLLHSIEEDGILVGIGSACSSHRESRFKSLLGLDDSHRDGIIRFSSSEFSSKDDVDFVVNSIKKRLDTFKNYKRV
ncbi:MAG: cysteine desulfurase [Clostridia bacterium]|nr:cysteine desulfurase [Clostridia bacterium]